MKRIITSIVLVALVASGVFWAVSRNSDEASNGRLRVAASFYPLYEFAKQVGGDKVQVSNLTPAGAEPHEYEPSAKALADAQDSDVFVYNGASFEPWVGAFLHDYKGVVVVASDGVDLHTEKGASDQATPDPHFWLDPVLAQQIVQNIQTGLSQADAGNAQYYAEHSAGYIAQLNELSDEFAVSLRNCTNDTIITSHSAFGYIAARYGFGVESIAGFSPEEEPSAARLAELSDLVRKEDVKFVFFESLVSPRLADTIAIETGAQTLELDPIEGISDENQKAGADYIRVQTQNLINLRLALECR